MNFKIAVIRGDGIGPEITSEALDVLHAIGKRFSHTFACTDVLAGGVAIDATGVPLPKETIEICLASDSVLLGAVGGPAWDQLPGHLRPEKALLELRAAMGLFANLRPALLYPALADACPLKPALVEGGLDLLIVRELIGGIYFGKRGRVQTEMGEAGYDTKQYSVGEVERIGKVAFEMARKRGKKVTSVDKANVLESSRVWRETMHRLKESYPDVQYQDMFVDNAAMQLVRNPRQFDVIVTGNMFGDILSDEASMITGSIGMLPSASLGNTSCGLFEPIHGSAPDIAGQGKANPLATILSVAMMLRYAFSLQTEANAVENAVQDVLDAGYRTPDIANDCIAAVTTHEMGQKVVEAVIRG